MLISVIIPNPIKKQQNIFCDLAVKYYSPCSWNYQLVYGINFARGIISMCVYASHPLKDKNYVFLNSMLQTCYERYIINYIQKRRPGDIILVNN